METEKLSLFETKGFSMWPFLRQGEKLIVKKAPMESLKVGDIILYQGDNQLVCHRLVKKVKNQDEYLFYSRGDNSNSSPELITKEKFLGKITGILRKNGKITNLMGRKQQFIHRFIVIFSPLIVKIIKPCYFKLRNYVKLCLSYRRPR